jgi:N-dimethylarginine dimethylaminohydrolase
MTENLVEKAVFDDAFDAAHKSYVEAIQKIFNEALDEQPQKPVQFSQQTYAAMKGAIIGLGAQMSATFALAAHRRIELEKRIEAIEGRGIKYAGIWQRAVRYERGDVTTDGGSAWIALKQVEGVRPGDGDGWQLMVKAGRDAR